MVDVVPGAVALCPYPLKVGTSAGSCQGSFRFSGPSSSIRIFSVTQKVKTLIGQSSQAHAQPSLSLVLLLQEGMSE